MRADQWFLVLSAGFFGVAGWMAYKRMLWFRWVGYHAVMIAAATYHMCTEDAWCMDFNTQQDLDHIAAIWFVCSTVLLLANFKEQVVETIVQLLIVVGASVMVILEYEDRKLNMLLFCVGVCGVCLCATWYFYGEDPIQWRIPWVASGVLFLVAGGVIFWLPYHDNLWLQGSWHICGGLGAACLVYGTRDPNLNAGYHVMRDVFYGQ